MNQSVEYECKLKYELIMAIKRKISEYHHWERKYLEQITAIHPRVGKEFHSKLKLQIYYRDKKEIRGSPKSWEFIVRET